MKDKESRSRSRFFGGVVALTLGNLFVKVVGLVLKIPLHGILGDAGMVYYNNAYDIYAWLFTIATTGLPTAISMLISEDRVHGNFREIKKIFRVTLGLFIIIGILGSAIMFFGAAFFERAYKITDSRFCMMAVAPTLFFICVASALRGYFQGFQHMVPTAVSEVIEATGKLAVGLTAAGYLLRAGYGITGAAAGAVFGVTCGELLAVLYLLWRVRRGVIHMLRHPPKQSSDFSKLVQLMIPVTLGAAVMTISGFLDMAVVYRRLPAAGFSAQQIVAAYGAYTGMALTLFNLPQALSNAVSVSVLPVLSAAHAKERTKQTKQLLWSSMGLTLLVCVPCGIGLFVLAQPLLQILFASHPRGIQTATPLLRLLGIAEPLVGLSTVTVSVLQAFGRPDLSVYAMTAACSAKFAVGCYLAGQPDVNILALPIGTLVCYSILLLMNLGFIAHVLRQKR